MQTCMPDDNDDDHDNDDLNDDDDDDEDEHEGTPSVGKNLDRYASHPSARILARNIFDKEFDAITMSTSK